MDELQLETGNETSNMSIMDSESCRSADDSPLSDAASISSLDALDEKCLPHKISLINILDISTSGVFSDTDLDVEQDNLISQAMSSDRTTRAQKLEKAIKLKDMEKEVIQSPRRLAYTASPSHNATRYYKPKDRITKSEGGSPLHAAPSNDRTDSSRQVSVTSINANIYLPMDRLSKRLFNPPEQPYIPTNRAGYQNGGSCFGGRGRHHRHYIIHPDWVSENLNISRAQFADRGQEVIDAMKRSQSCPPTQRNVITWELKLQAQ